MISLVVAAGCSRGSTVDARANSGADVPAHLPGWLESALDADVIDAGVVARRAPGAVAAPWSLENIAGAVAVDSTERARVGDGAGGSLRPGNTPPSNRAARARQELYAGDRIETGEGDATLRAYDGATTVQLARRARVVVPPFGGSDLVVTRGVVTVRISPGGTTRHAVDTPGARVVARGGTLLVAVADGGQTMLAATDAPAEVFLPLGVGTDADAGVPTARSLTRLPLAPGHTVWLDSAGHTGTAPMPPATDAGAHTFCARFNADVAQPGGHLAVVRDMARAGAQDLADARVLLPELRTLLVRPPGVPATAPGGVAGAAMDDEADALENQLGAALGRALARADRARALASRGGDVGALFGLAELESVAGLARVVLPLPVLDSAERRRVP